jgi:beta-glucanase (GH16 family)
MRPHWLSGSQPMPPHGGMEPAIGRGRVRAERCVRGWIITNVLLSACAAYGAPLPPSFPPTSAPVISATAALNGALIVRLETSTRGAIIFYTLDGSEPGPASQVYDAPFLVVRSLTVEAIARVGAGASSPATKQTFNPRIASGALVWSQEFGNQTGAAAAPDPRTWTFDTGHDGFGNHELEDYCAWGSNDTPCLAAQPNAFVGTDGYLHVVARRPAPGVYTSARLKSQGLFSFRYGRIEFRARVPEGQGFWPAAWLLGNNIVQVNWPACGEQDILERVDLAKSPDWNEGSVHGPGFTGSDGFGAVFSFPTAQTAAQWHAYGMIWTKGAIAFYVDDPTHPYASYTPASLKALPGAAWPFDDGQQSFLLINLAIGGDWPGPPDTSTVFPSEMLVDYVRIYNE